MPSSDAARAWLQANLTLDSAQLQAALEDAQADGYVSGALALASNGGYEPLPVALTGKAKTQSLREYWDAWKPGDVAASDLLDDKGFQGLLDDAGVTIKGLAETTISRLGTILAEGAAAGHSVDDIADRMDQVLNDPNRAYIIADTELARVVTESSLDTFAQNGISQFDWLVSDGACDECEAMADTGPHNLGDDAPPLHPGCRCAATPVTPIS